MIDEMRRLTDARLTASKSDARLPTAIAIIEKSSYVNTSNKRQGQATIDAHGALSLFWTIPA